MILNYQVSLLLTLTLKPVLLCCYPGSLKRGLFLHLSSFSSNVLSSSLTCQPGSSSRRPHWYPSQSYQCSRGTLSIQKHSKKSLCVIEKSFSWYSLHLCGLQWETQWPGSSRPYSWYTEDGLQPFKALSTLGSVPWNSIFFPRHCLSRTLQKVLNETQNKTIKHLLCIILFGVLSFFPCIKSLKDILKSLCGFF